MWSPSGVYVMAHIHTYIHHTTNQNLFTQEVDNKWWSYCVCACVVYFHPIYSERQACGRTSRGRTIFLHFPFCVGCLNFYREKDSAVPFPRRPWSRILYTHESIVLHYFLLGMIFILFYTRTFYVRKNKKSQFVWQQRDSNSRSNVRRFRGYQLNNQGGRNTNICIFRL